jgi:hypothetical protein
MPYGYLRENTASYWMNIPAATSSTHYPTNGQGGATTNSANSQLVSCGASNPVILEAVEVGSCSTADQVRIYNFDGSAQLFEINVKVDAGTQWFPMGGAYGVQINQGFGAMVDSGTNLSGVKVYYRFAGQ